MQMIVYWCELNLNAFTQHQAAWMIILFCLTVQTLKKKSRKTSDNSFVLLLLTLNGIHTFTSESQYMH